MSSPIPVLLLVRELGIGGCERDLAKMAKALDRSVFTPHVAAFHDTGLRRRELDDAGIPVLKLPVTSFYSWSALRGAAMMRRYIREHGVHVVHAYDIPTSIFAAPVARACGVPAVITSQLGFRYMFPPRQQRLMRIIDHIAHKIVVNSNAVRRHMVADEGIAPERLHLCYNGVETREFYPAVAERTGALAGARLVIGSVCALREEKRMDWLLRAFARVRESAPGVMLLIVGSGPELPRLEKMRKELGIEQNCVLQPQVADVPDWMRVMDVFVLPSSSESFPNTILEAMACGSCVVGSRVGGIPEMITAGEDGLLFEPTNFEDLVTCLRTAIEEPSLRRRFGVAAAETARKRFSMEIAAENTGSLYLKMLGREGQC